MTRLRYRWRYWRRHVNDQARAREARRFQRKYGYPA